MYVHMCAGVYTRMDVFKKQTNKQIIGVYDACNVCACLKSYPPSLLHHQALKAILIN